MHKVTVQTSFGSVTVSPLPAYVQAHLSTLAGTPTVPMEIVSGLGGTEMLPARPGSPEYENYMRALEEAEQRRRQLILVAAVGLGIKQWSIGNETFADVPDGWELPPEYAEIAPSKTISPSPPLTEEVLRRADYLLLQVLVDAGDLDKVVRAAVGGVTAEDVNSAERMFRG